MHDRAFPSAASAETDARCRSEAFYRNHAGAHDTALHRDGGHDFRNAVALCLARETIHDERGENAPQNEHREHLRAPDRVKRRGEQSERECLLAQD